MELGSIMLANYAEDNNGLLYVQGGGWDTISVGAPLPSGPPEVFAIVQGFLVVRVLFHQTETGREHTFAVTIADEDGQELGRIEGQANVVKMPGIPSTWKQNVNMVIPLTGLGLPRPGQYRIDFLVNGQHIGEQPFRAIKAY